ncbi:hypothetical protein RRG08_025107 [Elysia crispata]|uniref:Uncharacterized protein n=1 Tax=Elysia crispata TaxID=231223 RepID=A0AAE1AKE9_9GAST|nr:hypothetical protein RRG08_025107 [Elysia crispata]
MRQYGHRFNRIKSWTLSVGFINFHLVMSRLSKQRYFNNGILAGKTQWRYSEFEFKPGIKLHYVIPSFLVLTLDPTRQPQDTGYNTVRSVRDTVP